MSLEMPSELDWLFKLLAGQEWPKGDEDKLRALGRAWTEFSTSVQEISGEFEPYFTTVTSNLSGQPADAFKQFVTQMHQQLPAMVDAGKQISKLSSQTAQQVEYSKYMIIGQLVLLAAELAWAAANAFWTFGASEAMTPAFIAATRLTVSMILRRLAMAILTGVVSQVALDVAIQTIQAIKAKINGDDFSWNWSNTGSAAEMGAIGGALGGGIGMGLNKFKTTGFGDTFGGQLLTGGLSGLGMTEISNLMNHDDANLLFGLTSGLAGALGGGGRRGHGGDTPHMGDIHVGDVNNVHFEPNKFGPDNEFTPPPNENLGNGNGNHSGLDGLNDPPRGVGGNNFTSNGNNGDHVPVESQAPPPSGSQNNGSQNNGGRNENLGGQNPPVQHEDSPPPQQNENVPPPVETPSAQPPRGNQGSQQEPPPSRSSAPPPQQSAPPRGQNQNPPVTHQSPPPVEHNAPPVQHQTETPPPAQVHTPPVSEHGQTPPPVEQHQGGQQQISPPPVQHQAPPVEHNAPPVQQQGPPVQHQTPPTQHNAPPTQHEAPPVQHQALPVQHQAPPVQHQTPPATQHNAPPVEHNAPPVQHEAPPVEHNAPPVQHEAPPVQHNEPPVGQEAPPVQHQASPPHDQAAPPPVQHQDNPPQEQPHDNTADHNLSGPVRTAAVTTGGGSEHGGPTRGPQTQPHAPEEAAPPPPMMGGQNHDDAPANNNRNSGDYRQTTPPPSRSTTPGPDTRTTSRPNDTNTPRRSEPVPPKRVDTSGGPAKPKTEADKTPVTEHDTPEKPKQQATNQPPKQQATHEPPKRSADDKITHEPPRNQHDDDVMHRPPNAPRRNQGGGQQQHHQPAASTSTAHTHDNTPHPARQEIKSGGNAFRENLDRHGFTFFKDDQHRGPELDPTHNPDKPAYIATVPVHHSKDLHAIAKKYEEAINDPDGRFTLVLGVNGMDHNTSVHDLRNAINELDTKSANNPLRIPVKVVPFTWHHTEQRNQGSTEQNHLPYGLFREVLVRHDTTTDLIGNLEEHHPVYLHTGDPDVQHLKTVRSPDGSDHPIGVFDYADHHLSGEDSPNLLSGGYTVEGGNNGHAAKLDLDVRDAIAQHDPKFVYFPEPNTFVKVPKYTGLDGGVTWGRGDKEGQSLASSVKNTMGDHSVFDHKMAIATDGDRIGDKVDQHAHGLDLLDNVGKLTQSHADKSTWQSRMERYLNDEHKIYSPEMKTLLADTAFHGIPPKTEAGLNGLKDYKGAYQDVMKSKINELGRDKAKQLNDEFQQLPKVVRDITKDTRNTLVQGMQDLYHQHGGDDVLQPPPSAPHRPAETPAPAPHNQGPASRNGNVNEPTPHNGQTSHNEPPRDQHGDNPAPHNDRGNEQTPHNDRGNQQAPHNEHGEQVPHDEHGNGGKPFADPKQWEHRRDEKLDPAGKARTEHFDPGRGPIQEHTRGDGSVVRILDGTGTRIRYDVRRIQLDDGSYVRDYHLKLNLRPGEGTSMQDVRDMQDHVKQVFDNHVNQKYRFDNGDQFHVHVDFNSKDPHADVTVHGTKGENDRSDQLNWYKGEKDGVYVHEPLHFLGLKDLYKDEDSLFRHNKPEPDDAGVMGKDGAHSDAPVLNPRHLKTIDDATNASAVVHDLPYRPPADTHGDGHHDNTGDHNNAGKHNNAGHDSSATKHHDDIDHPPPAAKKNNNSSHAGNQADTPPPQHPVGEPAPAHEKVQGGNDFKNNLRKHNVRLFGDGHEFGPELKPGSNKDKPAYIATVPAVHSKDLVDIVNKYEAAISEPEGRFALVLGVNGQDHNTNSQHLQSAVDKLAAKSSTMKFPVKVVPFTWRHERPADQGSTAQDKMPYGVFREVLVRHDLTRGLMDNLYDDHEVFIHTGDADAHSLRTPDGQGLFDKADAHVSGDNPPSVLSGGYRLPGDGNKHDAGELDLAVRQAAAQHDPSFVYFPEPNTFVHVPKYAGLGDGVTWGRGSKEGQALMDSAHGRIDGQPHFDRDLSIVTDADRIADHVDSNLTGVEKLGNLGKLTQSHADKGGWQDRMKQYLEHKNLNDPALATSLADAAFHGIPPKSADELHNLGGKGKDDGSKDFGDAFKKSLQEKVLKDPHLRTNLEKQFVDVNKAVRKGIEPHATAWKIAQDTRKALIDGMKEIHARDDEPVRSGPSAPPRPAGQHLPVDGPVRSPDNGPNRSTVDGDNRHTQSHHDVLHAPPNAPRQEHVMPGSFDDHRPMADEPEARPMQSHGPNLDNVGLVESVLRSSAFQHVPVDGATPFVGRAGLKSTMDSVVDKVAQDPHRFEFDDLDAHGLSKWAAGHFGPDELGKFAPDLRPDHNGLSDEAHTQQWRDALANDLAGPSAKRWQVVRAGLGDEHLTGGDREVLDHVTDSVVKDGALPTSADLVTKGLQTPSWNDSHVGKHLPDTVAHALDVHLVVDHNGEQTHHGPADAPHVEVQSHDGQYHALGEPTRKEMLDGMEAWLSAKSMKDVGDSVVDLVHGRQDEGLYSVAQGVQKLKRAAGHPGGPQQFMHDLMDRAANLENRIAQAKSEGSWKPKSMRTPDERAAQAQRDEDVKQLGDLLKATNQQIDHLKANSAKVGAMHVIDKHVAGENADGLEHLGPNALHQLDEHLSQQISAAEKAGFDSSELHKLHDRVQNELPVRRAVAQATTRGIDSLKSTVDDATEALNNFRDGKAAHTGITGFLNRMFGSGNEEHVDFDQKIRQAEDLVDKAKHDLSLADHEDYRNRFERAADLREKMQRVQRLQERVQASTERQHELQAQLQQFRERREEQERQQRQEEQLREQEAQADQFRQWAEQQEHLHDTGSDYTGRPGLSPRQEHSAFKASLYGKSADELRDLAAEHRHDPDRLAEIEQQSRYHGFTGKQGGLDQHLRDLQREISETNRQIGDLKRVADVLPDSWKSELMRRDQEQRQEEQARLQQHQRDLDHELRQLEYNRIDALTAYALHLPDDLRAPGWERITPADMERIEDHVENLIHDARLGGYPTEHLDRLYGQAREMRIDAENAFNEPVHDQVHDEPPHAEPVDHNQAPHDGAHQPGPAHEPEPQRPFMRQEPPTRHTDVDMVVPGGFGPVHEGTPLRSFEASLYGLDHQSLQDMRHAYAHDPERSAAVKKMIDLNRDAGRPEIFDQRVRTVEQDLAKAKADRDRWNAADLVPDSLKTEAMRAEQANRQARDDHRVQYYENRLAQLHNDRDAALTVHALRQSDDPTAQHWQTMSDGDLDAVHRHVEQQIHDAGLGGHPTDHLESFAQFTRDLKADRDTQSVLDRFNEQHEDVAGQFAGGPHEYGASSDVFVPSRNYDPTYVPSRDRGRQLDEARNTVQVHEENVRNGHDHVNNLREQANAAVHQAQQQREAVAQADRDVHEQNQRLQQLQTNRDFIANNGSSHRGQSALDRAEQEVRQQQESVQRAQELADNRRRDLSDLDNRATQARNELHENEQKLRGAEGELDDVRQQAERLAEPEIMWLGRYPEHALEPIRFMRDNYPQLRDLNAPRYNAGHQDSMYNCVNVVVSTIETLTGNRTVPHPSLNPRSGDLLTNHYGREQRMTSGPQEIADTLRAAGPGSHGIVFEHRSDGGHVFNAFYDRDLNSIVFLDAQNGRLASMSDQHRYGFMMVIGDDPHAPTPMEIDDGQHFGGTGDHTGTGGHDAHTNGFGDKAPQPERPNPDSGSRKRKFEPDEDSEYGREGVQHHEAVQHSEDGPHVVPERPAPKPAAVETQDSFGHGKTPETSHASTSHTSTDHTNTSHTSTEHSTAPTRRAPRPMKFEPLETIREDGEPQPVDHGQLPSYIKDNKSLGIGRLLDGDEIADRAQQAAREQLPHTIAEREHAQGLDEIHHAVTQDFDSLMGHGRKFEIRVGDEVYEATVKGKLDFTDAHHTTEDTRGLERSGGTERATAESTTKTRQHDLSASVSAGNGIGGGSLSASITHAKPTVALESGHGASNTVAISHDGSDVVQAKASLEITVTDKHGVNTNPAGGVSFDHDATVALPHDAVGTPAENATAHDVKLSGLTVFGAESVSGVHEAFDKIAKDLDPKITEIGSPGRKELLHFTSAGNIEDNLPAMAKGWLYSPDLISADGSKIGSVRMRIEPTTAVLESSAKGYKIGSTLGGKSGPARTNTTTSGGDLSLAGTGAGIADPTHSIAAGAGLSVGVSKSDAVGTSGGDAAKWQSVLESDGVSGLYKMGFKLHMQVIGHDPVTVHNAESHVRMSGIEAGHAGLQLPHESTGRFEPTEQPRHAPSYLNDGKSLGLAKVFSLSGGDDIRDRVAETLRGNESLKDLAPDYGSDKFRNGSRGDTALAAYNRRELDAKLSDENLHANMNSLLGDGLKIRLKKPGLFFNRYVTVTVKASLGELQHLGKSPDHAVRGDGSTSVKLGITHAAKRGATVAADGRATIPFTTKDVKGAPTASLGVQYGYQRTWQSDAGPAIGHKLSTGGSENVHGFKADVHYDVSVTDHSRSRSWVRRIVPGLPGADVPQTHDNPHTGTTRPAGEITVLVPESLTSTTAPHTHTDNHTTTRMDEPPSITDLRTQARGARQPEFQRVEAIVGAEHIQRAAIEALTEAGEGDRALSLSGTVSADALFHTFSPENLTADPQMVSHGVQVDGLQHNRRIQDRVGAVGMTMELSDPKLVSVSDDISLKQQQSGGYTASGGKQTVHNVAVTIGSRTGMMLTPNVDHARGRSGLFASGNLRNWSWTSKKITSLAGTAEHSVSSPQGRTVVVRMNAKVHVVAESRLTNILHDSDVRTAGRTVDLPDSVFVRVTEQEARDMGVLPKHDLAGETPQGPKPGLPVPSTLDTSKPSVGFGYVEPTGDLVNLVPSLRTNLGDLGAKLLPKSVLDDAMGNLRRLDEQSSQDGVRGLADSALNGGVSLMTPKPNTFSHDNYEVVLHAKPTEHGATYLGVTNDGSKIAHNSTGTATEANTTAKDASSSVGARFTGTGLPDTHDKAVSASVNNSVGASVSHSTGHKIVSTDTTEHQQTSSSGGPQARFKLPTSFQLEFKHNGERLALSDVDTRDLIVRKLADDVSTAPEPPISHDARITREYGPSDHETWRQGGESLPDIVHVDDFLGSVDDIRHEARGLAGNLTASSDHALTTTLTPEVIKANLPAMLKNPADLPGLREAGVSASAKLTNPRLAGVSDSVDLGGGRVDSSKIDTTVTRSVTGSVNSSLGGVSGGVTDPPKTPHRRDANAGTGGLGVNESGMSHTQAPTTGGTVHPAAAGSTSTKGRTQTLVHDVEIRLVKDDRAVRLKFDGASRVRVYDDGTLPPAVREAQDKVKETEKAWQDAEKDVVTAKHAIDDAWRANRDEIQRLEDQQREQLAENTRQQTDHANQVSELRRELWDAYHGDDRNRIDDLERQLGDAQRRTEQLTNDRNRLLEPINEADRARREAHDQAVEAYQKAREAEDAWWAARRERDAAIAGHNAPEEVPTPEHVALDLPELNLGAEIEHHLALLHQNTRDVAVHVANAGAAREQGMRALRDGDLPAWQQNRALLDRMHTEGEQLAQDRRRIVEETTTASDAHPVRHDGPSSASRGDWFSGRDDAGREHWFQLGDVTQTELRDKSGKVLGTSFFHEPNDRRLADEWAKGGESDEAVLAFHGNQETAKLHVRGVGDVRVHPDTLGDIAVRAEGFAKAIGDGRRTTFLLACEAGAVTGPGGLAHDLHQALARQDVTDKVIAGSTVMRFGHRNGERVTELENGGHLTVFERPAPVSPHLLEPIPDLPPHGVVDDKALVATLHGATEETTSIVLDAAKDAVDGTRTLEGEEAAGRLASAFPHAMRLLEKAGVVAGLLRQAGDSVTAGLTLSHVLEGVARAWAQGGNAAAAAAVAQDMKRMGLGFAEAMEGTETNVR